MRRTKMLLLSLVICSAAAGRARAEGTINLGEGQGLNEATELSVDILRAGEVINIAGGTRSCHDLEIQVLNPAGVQVNGSPVILHEGHPAWLSSLPSVIHRPVRFVTTGPGTFVVRLINVGEECSSNPDEEVVDPFDVSVTPDCDTPVRPAQPVLPGRVSSTHWVVNPAGRDEGSAGRSRLYGLVPTGPSSDLTWMVALDGIGGSDRFELLANSLGRQANGYYGTSSDLDSDAYSPSGEHRLYLLPPAIAKGGTQAPGVSGFRHQGATAGCVMAMPGAAGAFVFTATRPGTYVITIDTDGRAGFDPSRDVALHGKAVAGLNTVAWRAQDAQGRPLAVGTYSVQLSLRNGELHLLAHDVDTLRNGLRIFRIDTPSAPQTAASTPMFWDDRRVNTLERSGCGQCAGNPEFQGGSSWFQRQINQCEEAQQIAPENTHPQGLPSGRPGDAAVCSEPRTAAQANAHCWGDFHSGRCWGESPGRGAWIDTAVFAHQTATTLTLRLSNPNGDDDSDGVPNRDECQGGGGGGGGGGDATRDSDGDGLTDATERGKDAAGNPIPGANPTDPNNPDTDGDGLKDGVEDANHNGKFDRADAFSSGETNPNNRDTDGDTLPDGWIDGNHNGVQDRGEGEDFDRDGIVDATETDPRKADTDGDGLPDNIELGLGRDRQPIERANPTNPRDADSDDDGLLDGREDLNADGRYDQVTETNPNRPDTDGDGLIDGCVDANGDGCTRPEGEDLNRDGDIDQGETDPKHPDTDRGGEPDGSEVRGGRNPLDPSDDLVDRDNDGLPDRVEDTDQDGTVDPGETDPGNPDTDGDGLPDGVEDANQNGTVDPGETDPRNPDTDGGGEQDGSEVNAGRNPLDPADDVRKDLGIFGGGGCVLATDAGNPGSLSWLGLLLVGCVLVARRRRASRAG